MNKTLAQAGWPNAPGILSGYVEPFDSWSDMSHKSVFSAISAWREQYGNIVNRAFSIV